MTCPSHCLQMAVRFSRLMKEAALLETICSDTVERSRTFFLALAIMYFTETYTSSNKERTRGGTKVDRIAGHLAPRTTLILLVAEQPPE